MSYESYNHMTIRPFKGDELVRDEYCNGNNCKNPMSLITLMRNEKIILIIIERSCVMYNS